MVKANKVRGVYAVLRDVADINVDARDLLECAHLLVEATEDSIYEPKVSLNMGPPPISELPLDVVFEHMSWKLLNREVDWEDEYDYIPHETQWELFERCLACAA